MDFSSTNPFPEGVVSFLDNDLYKLTMQCAVLRYFPKVEVSYAFKNRTPQKKLSRAAFNWLHAQIMKLGNIYLSHNELHFLELSVQSLNKPYLDFLREFRLNPREQVLCTFTPDVSHNNKNDDDDDDGTVLGTLELSVKGLWVETILYEIPLLALTSEAYFRFIDADWTYDGQEEIAYAKGLKLMEAGCTFSEFGTRRRRDYHTQALVLCGLIRAQKEAERSKFIGKISGTSNVHLAMRFDLVPIGTIAHEWFMGVAAIINDYETATYKALSYWVDCFGGGELGHTLTDTFGTPNFLKTFSQPIPGSHEKRTFAESFSGVRQDSGDPIRFLKLMKEFYEKQNIRNKTIIFSDSLNIESCLNYQKVAKQEGLKCIFGIGTFFTNDFVQTKTGQKSTPLNIVMKLSLAAGKPAIKLSDNISKNSGDPATVEKVKSLIGYVETDWKLSDEGRRWEAEEQRP